MPMYTYKCSECNHRFDAKHGFNDPKPVCENCQHADVQRVITTAPSIAKGIMANAGDGRRASKEQLQDKWAEETPKLRKKLVEKLGEDTVRRNAPSLGTGDN